ncbi:putative SWI/SNF-related matrix-associated actin-dependent regulator of chromatin subfamily A member 3-like 1 [Rutidosis leptorrhynchoides]|uniref:putative SWI/SNF-related matrix-associated actin-dependent regulator of chromatin subfamily A member 3-like 1 n=1 Tax=Rutidosis leptorrhynchoides TaxID=125765 RepID=UPI003A99886F
MSLYQSTLAYIEDEEEDQDQSTQSQSQSQSDTYMVGFIIANIVGLQYYSGRISGREMVGLVREPMNQYDSNAIKVLNTRTIQVGHIEKKVASVLAPLIDSNLIHVEGIVPKPSKKGNMYKIPCHVHVFTKLDAFETVKSAFWQSGLSLLSENSPLFSTSESMVVKEKKKGDVDEIFKLVDENLSQNKVNGIMEPPKDLILPDLFLHQKEGLYWLYHRENSDELPPFWEVKDGVFVNVLTHYETDKRPEPLRGGIFADDMGLGKTLTLLSLIALDKCNASNDGKIEVIADETKPLVISSGKRSRKGKVIQTGSRSKKQKIEDYVGQRGSKMTLIVCPPSVFSTWITQLTDHTKRGMLKAYMYYGERTQDVLELQKYDIVLTTYSTLSYDLESSNSKSPIKKIEWWRVILDEAHIIKNHKSKQSEAVNKLNAKRRWVVTGTPIQNGSMDLFSLMAFLRFDPFSTKSYWDSLVQRPIVQGNAKGLSRLQALMATISLRRTKEKALIGLPSKTIHICNVELSEDERKVYDEMEFEAKKFVTGYIERGMVTRHYSTVLSIILRLRQICTHMELVPSDVRSSISSYNFEDASNNPELLKKLVILLQDSEDIDCPICLSPPSKIIITCCAHIFCQNCITRTLNSKALCPLCRRKLSESDLFAPPPEFNPEVDNSSYQSSSKMAALIELLKGTRNENPSIKSVVFSQFRKLLLLLEEPLKKAGFKTLRLDGVMNAKKRANVMKEFEAPNPDGPTILLASLKASGTGINLTAASRVYLMEPWWNPAVEAQAMDRVHRIGQKEEVKIVKMIAKNSIDERITLLQEKKQKLAKEAFGKKGKEEKREINLDDLRTLMSL